MMDKTIRSAGVVAAKRVVELKRAKVALQMAIGVVQRDLDRWRNVQAGSPRKREQWRRG